MASSVASSRANARAMALQVDSDQLVEEVLHDVG